MKKVKYLLMTLLVSLVAVTGCGKKNELSPTEAMDKASGNMKTLENYKMAADVNFNMSNGDQTMKISAKLDATVDMKNNKIKMTLKADAMDESIDTEMYIDSTDGKNAIIYMKQDGEWIKTESENLNLNVDVDAMNFVDLSKVFDIKEAGSDSNNYNYDVKFTKDLMDQVLSLIGDNASTLPIDIEDIMKKMSISMGIDKKTGNFSKLSIDLKKLLSDVFASADETSDIKVKNAEFTIKISDYNEAGSVEIPKNVIDNAISDDDDSSDFGAFDDDDYDKVLTCKYEEDNKTINIKMGFNNSNAEYGYMKEVHKFETSKEAEDFYNELLDDEDYAEYVKSLVNKTVTLTYTEDLTDADANEVLSYDLFKMSFESEGYTCN